MTQHKVEVLDVVKKWKGYAAAQLIGGDGFDDVTHEEFNELIDTHSQALTDEDLAELTKSAEEETEDQEDPSQEDELLTLERLAELMRTAKELQEKAKSWDPYMVRSLQLSNAIDSSMSTYKTLFTNVKNTTKPAVNYHVPNEGQEK